MNNYRLSWHNLYTYINVVIQRHLQSYKEIQISETWSCKFTPAHEASQQLIQHAMLSQETQDGINETVTEWCHSITIACAASRHPGKPSIHGTFMWAWCMAAFRMYSATTGGVHYMVIPNCSSKFITTERVATLSWKFLFLFLKYSDIRLKHSVMLQKPALY